MKELIIDCIAELIYQSTWSQSGYDNRLKGFLAESLAPSEIVSRKGYKALQGGWIIPLNYGKRFRDTKNILYLTVINKQEFLHDEKHYCEIYNKLEKFSDKYIAIYQIDFEKEMELCPQFSTMKFPNIEIEYFKYNTNNNEFIPSNYEEIRSLSYKKLDQNKKPNTDERDRDYNQVLEQISEDSLYDILANRYIFDYLFGFLFFNRGIPSDFDMIVNFPHPEKKQYIIYEIKEKDPSKKNKNKNNVVGFGMDIERINDYNTLIKWFPSFRFRYIVRQIDNQQDRNFVNWRSIDMQDFINIAISDPDGESGGQGMLPKKEASKHVKTAICLLEKFKIINL